MNTLVFWKNNQNPVGGELFLKKNISGEVPPVSINIIKKCNKFESTWVNLIRLTQNT